MIIEDGGGSGRSVTIDSEGRLNTRCVTTTAEHEANHDHGESYNAIFAVDPDGCDDCIFYIKNTEEKDMIIEGCWWQTSAAEEVYYKLGDTGTAIKTHGSDITPANLNAGSGNIADILCYSNTADGAVDITGLSGGTTIQKLWLTSAASGYINAEQDIIVPKNQTFSIYCVGGDTLLRGTLVFFFHEIPS